MNPLAKPIAEGRTAEIYPWGDGYILKLYRDWCPPHWVENESKVAHAIVEAGIPTPAAGEIVEVDHRRGLIYERVRGISMLQDMNTHPWTFFKHARALAELQVRVHQLSVTGLYSCKDGLTYSIQHAPHISDDLRTKALKRLSSMNDGVNVCHGDFHPGNVLLTERGPVVIDWMTASAGNPWADVARTSMLLTIGPKGAGKQIHPVVVLLVGLFHSVYLNRYRKLIPDKNDEFKRWLPVIAAARLEEQIEPERDALIQMAAQGLTE